jgi:hypothetical protein
MGYGKNTFMDKNHVGCYLIRIGIELIEGLTAPNSCQKFLQLGLRITYSFASRSLGGKGNDAASLSRVHGLQTPSSSLERTHGLVPVANDHQLKSLRIGASVNDEQLEKMSWDVAGMNTTSLSLN